MAIDTNIIIEKQTGNVWEHVQILHTQDTRAWCAAKSVAETMNNFVSDIAAETFDFLKQYDHEADDTVPAISLEEWNQLLNWFDPNSSEINLATVEHAKKFKTSEHDKCIGILQDLTAEFAPEPQETYRVILHWGY